MLETIKLNIIKNRINDFELKSCVYIAPNNNKLRFNPRYYNDNKAPFYIVCSNKRKGNYTNYSYADFSFLKRNFNNNSINKLLSACDVDKDNLVEIYNIDLERFLLINRNKDWGNKEFLGWYPSNDVIDANILELKGNKYNKHHKDNIYYGNNIYNIDTNKLHLFVRIVPNDVTTLTNLIINCQRDNIYNICERSEFDKVGSLGFIVKLDEYKYEYYYSKTFKKINRIKYPFVTKNNISNSLFDGYDGDYKISTEIIYIKDYTNLNKYGIIVLDNF